MKKFFIVLLIFVLSPTLFAEETASPLKDRVIVLDAGHGTLNYHGRIINPGKISRSDQMEHDLNMKITAKLGKRLEQEGAKVYYTRTFFDYWRESYGTIEDNRSRAYFANELDADAYLSIHCDWHPNRRVKGVTTFFAKPNSKILGEMVHRHMVKGLKTRDRKLVFDSYTVLDTAEIPAILVETGFLSHREESKKLSKDSYQEKIATSIQNGLMEYFKTFSS